MGLSQHRMQAGGYSHYGIIIRLVFHSQAYYCVKPTKGELWRIHRMYICAKVPTFCDCSRCITVKLAFRAST